MQKGWIRVGQEPNALEKHHVLYSRLYECPCGYEGYGHEVTLNGLTVNEAGFRLEDRGDSRVAVCPACGEELPLEKI